MARRALPVIAALVIGIAGGFVVSGRYEYLPTHGLPIRLDKWTGRAELVVPAVPSPTPFDPDAFLAGK